jgi:heme/copper-type cytochrome/quinol oxidase subunit 2|tara:strand:- start:7647 stop:8390 length:744 start_codon:yes stop_codon:yes gene_type:complete
LEIGVAGTSVLFADLWEHYMLWSIVVSVIAFGWLFHHSFWFRSEDGKELSNVDGLAIGVFPLHNDDMRLEVTWTILPFILIIWLTYVSWAPIDNMWAPLDDDEYHGSECDYASAAYTGSNNVMDSKGMVTSDCYHLIEITGQQWFWSFDCLELDESLCYTATDTLEVYGSVPVLGLKKGETYLALMESEDVTHAPWFLDLFTKEDVLQGQQTLLWLPITDSGDSMILCAEYCGDAHSVMSGVLAVHN